MIDFSGNPEQGNLFCALMIRQRLINSNTPLIPLEKLLDVAKIWKEKNPTAYYANIQQYFNHFKREINKSRQIEKD